MTNALVRHLVPPVDPHDPIRVNVLGPAPPSVAPWDLFDSARSFVSVQRLNYVLARRFGCRQSGERGPGYVYWRTANGVPFAVEDPVAVPGSMAVYRADGTRQVCYAYEYVANLLQRVAALARAPRRRHGWN